MYVYSEMQEGKRRQKERIQQTLRLRKESISAFLPKSRCEERIYALTERRG
jgi:hypothetical protein